MYFILRSFDGKTRINPEKVCYFTIDANELRIHTTAGYFTERDMNGGVFFTRERAEQVLDIFEDMEFPISECDKVVILKEEEKEVDC